MLGKRMTKENGGLLTSTLSRRRGDPARLSEKYQMILEQATKTASNLSLVKQLPEPQVKLTVANILEHLLAKVQTRHFSRYNELLQQGLGPVYSLVADCLRPKELLQCQQSSAYYVDEYVLALPQD